MVQLIGLFFSMFVFVGFIALLIYVYVVQPIVLRRKAKEKAIPVLQDILILLEHTISDVTPMIQFDVGTTFLDVGDKYSLKLETSRFVPTNQLVALEVMVYNHRFVTVLYSDLGTDKPKAVLLSEANTIFSGHWVRVYDEEQLLFALRDKLVEKFQFS